MSKSKSASPDKNILLTEISFSPFNYRYGGQPVNEESLQELAASIKKHEVIQPITVRPKPDGKYELVVGERRYRASVIAGKVDIPATIRELSDEQAKEIQLIENLQRENPHPLAEAIGFYQLLHLRSKKNSVKEIAAQVAKSESYVYQRLKLNNLIERFKEMYFANALTTVMALKLASLDENSQEDFFSNNCEQWETRGWQSHNFQYRIKNYQLDLKEAPFDIKDAKLDKTAGACSKCQHNTAVISSLFPEETGESRCTNRACYDNKSRLFQLLNFAVVMKENPDMPIAVENEELLAQYFAIDDKLIKNRTVLISSIDFSDYDTMEDKPVPSDFDHWDEEEQEEAYQDALAEYEEELERMENEATAGNYLKAILIAEKGLGSIVYLYNKVKEPVSENRENRSYQPPVEYRAKDYQEAVKGKALTTELIEREKARLLKREERSKELDEEKLQEAFYDALENSKAIKDIDTPAGLNDHAAMVLIVYESLGFSARSRVDRLLITGEENENSQMRLMRFCFEATENQLSILFRIALLDDASAKSPTSIRAKMLRKVVEATPGLNSEILVIAQRQKREEREEVLSEKLTKLNRQADKLNGSQNSAEQDETVEQPDSSDQHETIESAA